MRRKMKKEPPPIRRRVCAILVVILLLGYGYLYVVQTAFKPTLEELAEYECRAIVVKAMNQAVEAEMEMAPELYTKLYTADYAADGSLLAIYADTAALNRAKATLIQAVEEALAVLEETNLKIPYGSLTGVTAFGGIGPSWKLTLLPDAYVEGTLQEETEAVSVNRTLYTITLNLQVTISMVLDGNTATAEVEDQIPVVSVLLNGEVPSYYAAAQ